MVGACIGNYRVVQRLGEGGMATVYLATHPTLGRRVAVKVLNADLARVDQMVQRFFNEARAASAIGHRGIVEVFDLGTLPSGAPYIVMEYLDGESLAERMIKTGRLSLEAAADIAAQAAGVMEVAHARGIVHRDLKPDNLFLVADPLFPGRELVKLLDFGIAKLTQRAADDGDQRTRTGVILGTPRYMSPEQCRESRDVDHRTDVYSLGVVLYEMLAGAPPFVSGSWGELAHMHIGVIPPPLQTHMPDVPSSVAEIVHRALEKDPVARFQSMAELARALRAAITARTAVLPASPVTEAPADTPPRARAPGPGATRRLNEPSAAAPARASRRTTLAAAATELLREPEQPRRAIRFAPVLVLASVAAAVAIFGALGLRRPSRPVATPAPAPPAAAAAAPPPVAAPPPPIVERAPPAAPPVTAAPVPPRPKRHKRRSPSPAKPAVPPPVDHRPRAPEKI